MVTFRESQPWKLLVGYRDSDPDVGSPNGFFSVSNEKARGVPGSPSSKIRDTFKKREKFNKKNLLNFQLIKIAFCIYINHFIY